MSDSSGSESWGHTQYLVEEIGARGSGTAQEAQAAAYVRQCLSALALPFEEQPFRSPASAWRPFAVNLALSASTALLAPLAVPASSLLAALLLLVTLWLGIRESMLGDTIYRHLLPQVDSQNVIGRIRPAGEARQTLVLVAHLDTHRTPFFHRSRRHQAWFGVLVFIAQLGGLVNALLYLALSVSGNLLWWWASLPIAALHLVLAISFAVVDNTPYSPGANDNAAAVGTALAVASELSRAPLAATDLWLLFSGCEEVGAYGMREFLSTYSPALTGARFIDLEMVGQGVPAVVIKEGLFRRIEYDPALITAAAAAAEATWQEPFYKKANAYGESVVTQRAGYPSVTLNSVRPETGKTAVWHRLDDDMRVISAETLAHVQAWVLALLRDLDRDVR